NGSGEQDAQHNKAGHGAGAATGNAPPWFPGQSEGHAHAAVLSGLKSQAMQASQMGTGAYSQLVFDDTPGQARVSLQHHASAHQGTDELNLGCLHHQSDNQRLGTVGFGAELKTGHSVAVRAGQGMLLSSDRRGGASGAQMDAREAHRQVTASRELQVALASTAEKHNAKLKGGGSTAPDKLPAVEQMALAASVIEGDAFTEPQIQLSSPSGIVAVTPASATVSAGVTSSIAAGQDINFVAQANGHYAVKDGISLFTYGKASAKEKPNQEVGIKLHAASGKVSSQSQGGETRITADKTVTVASVTKSVTAAAKKHVLMTAQGAYLKIEGGDIMLHAPGKVDIKATMKELTGPADGSKGAPTLPRAKDIYNEAFVVLDEETKKPMAHVRYRLESASGVQVEGITDSLGRTQRIFTSKSEKLTLHLPADE
ncbi:MAG TPA: type VI secretion system Vgr family protein, partial [Telluria sp.]|nr:type VI secretion system Vgr family protein [Telluria sp.]